MRQHDNCEHAVQYVCLYVHTYVHMSLGLHALCTRAILHMYVCSVYVCMCVRTYVCMYVHMYVCMYVNCVSGRSVGAEMPRWWQHILRKDWFEIDLGPHSEFTQMPGALGGTCPYV